MSLGDGKPISILGVCEYPDDGFYWLRCQLPCSAIVESKEVVLHFEQNKIRRTQRVNLIREGWTEVWTRLPEGCRKEAETQMLATLLAQKTESAESWLNIMALARPPLKAALHSKEELLYIQLEAPACAGCWVDIFLGEADIPAIDRSTSITGLSEGGRLHVLLPSSLVGHKGFLISVDQEYLRAVTLEQTHPALLERELSEEFDTLSLGSRLLRGFFERSRETLARKDFSLPLWDITPAESLATTSHRVRTGKLCLRTPLTVAAHYGSPILVHINGSRLMDLHFKLIDDHAILEWDAPLDWVMPPEAELTLVAAKTGMTLFRSPLSSVIGDSRYRVRLNQTGHLEIWERTICDGIRCFGLECRIGRHREALEMLIAPHVTRKGQFGLLVSYALPEMVFDTNSHDIEIWGVWEGSSDWIWMGDPIPFKTAYLLKISESRLDGVEGTLLNEAAPGRPVMLDAYVNGRMVASGLTDPKVDVGDDLPTVPEGHFSLAWPNKLDSLAGATIELRIKKHPSWRLPRRQALIPARATLPILSQLAGLLADPAPWGEPLGDVAASEAARDWIRVELLGVLQSYIRRYGRFPNLAETPLATCLDLPVQRVPEACTDVIVPVYGHQVAVMRCLTRVLFLATKEPLHLIVINDASPDKKLTELLRVLASRYGFTLLENQQNLGFPGAVNRGMSLHPDRDVVLLNSDTVIAEGWLDRLRETAYAEARVASVTPFSNHATILSYPRFCEANALPSDAEVEALDQCFATENEGLRIEIPTAVGFCMYIRRAALNEVGLFDAATWGRGYGEENDFCMRASSLGWKHLAACNVFVGHEGGGSFKEDSSSLLSKNLETLGKRYPDYFALVDAFIKKDPLRVARQRVQWARLGAEDRRFFLFVLHGLGGGTLKSSRDLAAELAVNEIEVLELASINLETIEIRARDGAFHLIYHAEEWETLIADLRQIGVSHVHFHQTMHFSPEIWALPTRLGVAYDFTIHDYFTFCPRINLMDETGRFCGENHRDAKVCDGCIEINGLEHDQEHQFEAFGGTVAAWRVAHDAYLRGARRIFSPSQTAADLFQIHFPLTKVVVFPHVEREIFAPSMARRIMRREVIVLGAIGPNKGYMRLFECARDARKRRLDLHFVVIGFTMDDEPLKRLGNVTITGSYTKETLPEKIHETGTMLALFLSPWPETYSYTLSEAWAMGLYPVALDIGAIGERIRAEGVGHLLPLDASAAEINNVVCDLLDESPQVAVSRHRALPPSFDALRDYYDLWL